MIPRLSTVYTKIGIDSARLQGRIGGRRPKLTDQQQAEIVKMVSRGERSAAVTARLFNVHPATISRILARTGKNTFPKRQAKR
ncbi:MAG: helix-turn-helix domain-containing protein [Acidobacteriota bacterium]|nr:helix-turn-helix domain-containing protein [Acidobacteriota bacterium]